MYCWVEHTGEVELEIDSDSEHGVFIDALDAVRELLGEGDEAVAADPGQRVEKAISVAAADRPRLLAAWLGELAYLAESDGFVPRGVRELRVGAGVLDATIRGHLGDPPHLIKAVTYHRLTFEPHDGRWRARVVLDV